MKSDSSSRSRDLLHLLGALDKEAMCLPRGSDVDQPVHFSQLASGSLTVTLRNNLPLILEALREKAAPSESALRDQILTMIPNACRDDRASSSSDCATCRIYAALKNAAPQVAATTVTGTTATPTASGVDPDPAVSAPSASGLTPRTDLMVVYPTYPKGAYVPAATARQLERELAAMTHLNRIHVQQLNERVAPSASGKTP